ATGENIAPNGTADFSQGKNIDITRTGNSIEVATVDDVEFNQVAIGDATDPANSTVITNAGDGLDVGGDTITNVGAPSNGGDAVNLDYFNENKAHYYSVNDGGTQQDNYDNDGADGVDSLAAGVNALADDANSVAVGSSAHATGGDADGGAVAVGYIAKANGDGATAIGSETIADADGATAIGDDANAKARFSTAIGDGAEVNSTGSLGPYASLGSVAIGAEAEINNSAGSHVLGSESSITGSLGSSILGSGNTIASSTYARAIGSNNDLSDVVDVSVLGRNNDLTGAEDSSVIGNDNVIGENLTDGQVLASAASISTDLSDVVAIGSGVQVAADEAIVIGATSQALGERSIALGYDAIATGSIAMGASSRAGNGGAAFGDGAVATYNGGVNDSNIVAGAALGENASADVPGAVALGTDAEVTDQDSVALGSGSVADGSTLGDPAYQPLDAAGNPIAVAAPTAGSEFSVGDTGTERRITNVAAGATDTDAVNVSQLKAVEQVASQGFNITADNTNLATADDNVKLGETVDFTSADGNIITTVDDNEIDFGLGND
ncbi:hypothetical protein OM427_30985, partial [Halomonas sp. 18H]|nr:hypothetical protein [Halomonas sp. 18H]